MAFADASVEASADFSRFDREFPNRLRRSVARATRTIISEFRRAGTQAGRAFADAMSVQLDNIQNAARLAGAAAGRAFVNAAELFTREIDVGFAASRGQGARFGQELRDAAQAAVSNIPVTFVVRPNARTIGRVMGERLRLGAMEFTTDIPVSFNEAQVDVDAERIGSRARERVSRRLRLIGITFDREPLERFVNAAGRAALDITRFFTQAFRSILAVAATTATGMTRIFAAAGNIIRAGLARIADTALFARFRSLFLRIVQSARSFGDLIAAPFIDAFDDVILAGRRTADLIANRFILAFNRLRVTVTNVLSTRIFAAVIDAAETAGSRISSVFRRSFDSVRGFVSRAVNSEPFQALARVAAEVAQEVLAVMSRSFGAVGRTAATALGSVGQALAALPGFLAEVGSSAAAALIPIALMVEAFVLLTPLVIGLAAPVANLALAFGLALGPALIGLAATVGVLFGAFSRLKTAMDLDKELTKAQERLDEVVRAQGRNSEAAKEARAELERLKAKILELPAPVRELGGALDRARQAFSQLGDRLADQLFEGVGKQIDILTKTVLPLLTPVLEGLAASFGNLGRSILSAFKLPNVTGGIADLIRSLGRTVDDFASRIPSFANAFGILASRAAPFLEKISKLLLDIGSGIADWIVEAERSGRLQEIFDNAATTFEKLLSIIGNVGEILGNLFAPAQEGGDDLLTTLDNLTQSLADFLGSEEGQKTIKELVNGIAELVRGIPGLISGFSEFVNQVKLLSSIADALIVTPGEIVTAWTIVKDFFSGLWESITNGVTGALQSIGGFFSSIGTTVSTAFSNVLTSVGTFFANLGTSVANGVTTVQTFFFNLGVSIGTSIRTAFDNVITMFTGLGQRALTALAGLRTTVTTFFFNLGVSIGTSIRTAVDKVFNLISQLPGRLGALGNAFLTVGAKLIGQLMNGLLRVGSSVANFVSSIGSKLKSWINANVIGGLERSINAVLPFSVSLPRLAQGGLALGPSILGEAGKELAVPLNDPRAQAAIRQALGGVVGTDSGIVFEPGAIQLNFYGETPTAAQATQIGNNVGNGVASTIARRNIRNTVRAL